MKIKIGSYKNWIGPYQIAEYLCFWVKDVEDKYGFKSKPDWVHDFGEWLADTWISDVCEWVDDKRKRKIKIKIDRYDTWSMDHTLAHIIVPMLIQLRDSKHGSAFVDDEDVPENIRSTSARPLTDEEKRYGHIDEFFSDRWDWVLNEMIWAFTEHRDDTWEEQYHSGTIEFESIPVDHNGNEVSKEDAELFRLDRGPNDTSEFDADGYQLHMAKIQNGMRLFGKYYMNLWD